MGTNDENVKHNRTADHAPEVGSKAGTTAGGGAEQITNTTKCDNDPFPDADSFGEMALWYGRHGFHVFPLRAGGKEPIDGSRGFHDATADPTTIAWHWKHNPDANIGWCPALSGACLIDLD